MSITIVAEKAGVSSSTVSRVINNHPRVSPETIRIVRRVMAEMGYVPSDRRPGPKPHRRNQLAARNVAFLKFSSRKHAAPGFELLLRGLAESSRRENLTLTVHDLVQADEFPRKIFDVPITGVLLHGAVPTPQLQKALAGVPTVWVMGNSRRPDWGYEVMPDSFTIGRLAAEYLAGRGHKHAAFFSLEGGHWPFRLVWQSFATCCEDLGMTVTKFCSPTTADPKGTPYDHTLVDALVEQFLKISPRPTGIFVADDFQAAMLHPALRDRGVKIGPDGGVDIVSCNNEEAYLMGLTPRPASIDIRVESIGRRAVDQLLWRSEHPTYEDRIVTLVEPRLVPADGVMPAAPEVAPV